jgi:hypothetical protein
MRRAGLGRRQLLQDDAGDPLEGLVNLFDLGIVLALAFLVAGLTVALTHRSTPTRSLPAGSHALPSTSGAARASGSGESVGNVYRLSDGRLVYVPSHSGR